MLNNLKHSDLACNCSPTEAWLIVESLTQQALAGDSISRRLLPWNVEHALALTKVSK